MRFLLVALALAALAPAARAQDPFAAHCDRASALAANEQFSEALAELEAAYAIRQSPSLLYAMGRMHRKLGHAKEALSSYQRFLTAETTPSPSVKAEVEAEIAELEKLIGDLRLAPAPPPDATGELNLRPLRFEVRRDRGLIGGGVSLFAVSYAAALISGSVLLGLSCSAGCNSRSGAMYGTLLLPVLGPFVSGFLLLTPIWSIPWMLVDGAGQVVGLALLIAGARARNRVPIYGQRFNLAPASWAGGGGLTVWGRF